MACKHSVVVLALLAAILISMGVFSRAISAPESAAVSRTACYVALSTDSAPLVYPDGPDPVGASCSDLESGAPAARTGSSSGIVPATQRQ